MLGQSFSNCIQSTGLYTKPMVLAPVTMKTAAARPETFVSNAQMPGTLFSTDARSLGSSGMTLFDFESES